MSYFNTSKHGVQYVASGQKHCWQGADVDAVLFRSPETESHGAQSGDVSKLSKFYEVVA